MSVNGISKHYGKLTAEERFRLILAASARGDDIEGDRLLSASRRITLSMSDHCPYHDAFGELALCVFIELSEAAACYCESLVRASEAGDFFGDGSEGEGHGDMAECESRAEVERRPAHARRRGRSPWQRAHNVARAAGFVLRTKMEGWKLFCQRKSIPRFELWKGLPGFGRIQHARDLAERDVFGPDDMVGWMNLVRRAGKPEATRERLLSPEKIADGLEKDFQQFLRLWGG
jgi:hypothetical protein